jgi:hypothetical protein
MNGSCFLARGFHRNNQPIPKSLVISFSVIVREVFTNGCGLRRRPCRLRTNRGNGQSPTMACGSVAHRKKTKHTGLGATFYGPRDRLSISRLICKDGFVFEIDTVDEKDREVPFDVAIIGRFRGFAGIRLR